MELGVMVPAALSYATVLYCSFMNGYQLTTRLFGSLLEEDITYLPIFSPIAHASRVKISVVYKDWTKAKAKVKDLTPRSRSRPRTTMLVKMQKDGSKLLECALCVC